MPPRYSKPGKYTKEDAFHDISVISPKQNAMIDEFYYGNRKENLAEEFLVGKRGLAEELLTGKKRKTG